ncbi:hypothetical protein IQ238_29550 [Pleurocapsales cyanobacterium LEGE 06147]|nr:hypothetical protein [Pleurocapsales cyanobacterium LEGE 06147]
MNRRTYQWTGAILFAFLISTLAGPLAQVMAQNAADDFFDQGQQELDQEAETLQQPQNPNSKPMLTIEEEPSPTENTGVLTNEEETEPGKPQIEDVPAPNAGGGDNLPEQPSEGEAEFKF